MPIPFILGGMALAAAGYGVKKGLDAKEDYDMAEYYNEKAERIYDEAKEKLEKIREYTQKELESLGKLKFKLYEESVIPFIETYKKIKNNQEEEKLLYKEGKVIEFNQNLSLKDIELELKELVSGGLASLGAGGLVGLASYGGVGMLATASTGTAIGTLSGAAATNATLAWLGGGSLAAGGFGMAGGMAVLGGIVAGPVLAVGGMMLASKAEEARENAYANLEQARLAAEEMKTAKVKTQAIQERVKELYGITTQINNYFVPHLIALKYLVDKETNWNKYRKYEQELVAKTGLLWRTLFNLLEVNILTKEGEVTLESKKAIEEAQLLLKNA